MKPRARRVTLAAAALGAGVVGLLVALNWGTVRDHVDAWWFQLTRHTEILELDPGWPDRLARALSRSKDVLAIATLPQALANSCGWPVIVDSTRWDKELDMAWDSRDFSHGTVLQKMREVGFCIREQHYPQNAYVVVAAPAILEHRR